MITEIIAATCFFLPGVAATEIERSAAKYGVGGLVLTRGPAALDGREEMGKLAGL